jgi:hypothetical protein
MLEHTHILANITFTARTENLAYDASTVEDDDTVVSRALPWRAVAMGGYPAQTG